MQGSVAADVRARLAGRVHPVGHGIGHLVVLPGDVQDSMGKTPNGPLGVLRCSVAQASRLLW